MKFDKLLKNKYKFRVSFRVHMLCKNRKEIWDCMSLEVFDEYCGLVLEDLRREDLMLELERKKGADAAAAAGSAGLSNSAIIAAIKGVRWSRGLFCYVSRVSRAICVFAYAMCIFVA